MPHFETVEVNMSRQSFKFAAWFAALIVLALSMSQSPAQPIPASQHEPDQGVETTNCFGTRHAEACTTAFRTRRINPHIIAVPQPGSDDDRATAAARDQRWVERCRPVVRQDQFGVPRYHYSAPGCEYGRTD
jgi:hypothetical protein